MFGFELSKIVVFAIVALVVVGPNELPAALRLLGRALGQWRRLRAQVWKAADELMAEASLEPEIASLSTLSPMALAANPATAMRGRLTEAPAEEPAAAPDYASPEMRAYLAPPEPEEKAA